MQNIEELWNAAEVSPTVAASDKLFKRLYCSPTKWSIPTEARVWRLGPPALYAADRSQKSEASRIIETAADLVFEGSLEYEGTIRSLYFLHPGRARAKYATKLLSPMMMAAVNPQGEVLLIAARFHMWASRPVWGWGCILVCGVWMFGLTFWGYDGEFLSVHAFFEAASLLFRLSFLLIGFHFLVEGNKDLRDPAIYPEIVRRTKLVRDALMEAGWVLQHEDLGEATQNE